MSITTTGYPNSDLAQLYSMDPSPEEMRARAMSQLSDYGRRHLLMDRMSCDRGHIWEVPVNSTDRECPVCSEAIRMMTERSNRKRHDALLLLLCTPS